MKYIVRNCPNCNIDGDCEISTGGVYFHNPCNKSDCTLKQIITMCKNSKKITLECKNKIVETVSFTNDLSREILNFLQIEEQ